MLVNALVKTLFSLISRPILLFMACGALVTAGLLAAFTFGISWLLLNTTQSTSWWLEWLIDSIGTMGASILA